MTYTISMTNGTTRKASNKKEALAIVRHTLGAINRGATYTTDGLIDDKDGQPIYGTATDFWDTRSKARNEMGTPANVVVFVPKKLHPSKAVC